MKEQLNYLEKFDAEIVKDIIVSFKKETIDKAYNIPIAVAFKPSLKKLFSLSSPSFMFHSRATLKVQDGCNNSCSFCRIRIARGKSISLPISEAINRIKEIEEKGANEVVLTGVNLFFYFFNSIYSLTYR